MTLEEAIKHCEDVAEDRCGCAEDCVNEHRQLAEWLKELKAYREADAPQMESQRNSEKVKGTPQNDCETCRHYNPHHEAIACERCLDGKYSRYEPQTEWHYDEQDATWYPYKHEDEPQQKSCATCKHALGNWDGESNNCGRCCGADRRFYEPKTESQTERSSE